MSEPNILAGRLRLLAERLDADGTFGGRVVAEEVREAADLLAQIERDRPVIEAAEALASDAPGSEGYKAAWRTLMRAVDARRAALASEVQQ